MKETNKLGDKKVFVFNVYIGNLDGKDIEKYVNDVSKRFETFNSYDDVEVFYVPVTQEPNIVLTRIS